MDLRRRHPLARMPRQQLREQIAPRDLHDELPSVQGNKEVDPSRRW